MEGSRNGQMVHVSLKGRTGLKTNDILPSLLLQSCERNNQSPARPDGEHTVNRGLKCCFLTVVTGIEWRTQSAHAKTPVLPCHHLPNPPPDLDPSWGCCSPQEVQCLTTDKNLYGFLHEITCLTCMGRLLSQTNVS